MAGFFNKLWSGADFWQRDENRSQREQFAREDEERRRREEARRRALLVTPQPGTVVRPTQSGPDPVMDLINQPLKKSTAFGAGFNNPILEQKDKPVDPEQVKKNELEELTKKHMAKALDEEKSRTSWLDRQFTDRNWTARAEAAARGRATKEFQDKHGWNRDQSVLDYGKDTSQKLEKARGTGASQWIAPVLSTGRVGTGIVEGGAGLYDILTPGKGQNRVTQASTKKAEEIDKLADDMNIEKLYKTTNVPLEIASYFTPTVVSKAGKVSKIASKASSKIDDIMRIASKTPRLRKFVTEAADEFLDPKNLEKEAELTGRYLGQDSAKGEDITAAVVGENLAQSVAGAFLPPFARRLLRKAKGGSAAEDAAIAGGGGATSQAIDKIDDVVRGADEVDNNIEIPEKATTPEVEVEPGVKTTPEPEDATIKTDEPQAIVEGKPAVEVEPGIKSTNLPTVPDAANPIALAKADTTGTTGDVPIADFKQPVDGSQLQKATPAGPDQIAAAVPEQQALPLDAPPAKATTQQAEVDVNGNPVLKSDAQLAQEMAESGIVPSPEPSAVGAAEDELQAAADQAAVEQVQTSNPASIREREAFARTEQDEALAQEIIDTVPSKQALNTEEMLSIARNNARAQNSEQLMASWGPGRTIDQADAQAWVNALEERKVLNALVSEGVPGAREARLNLADAMSQFQSKSGQNLNILKVAYDEMPADMKAELLIKKVDRARKQAGMDQLSEMEMNELLARVEGAEGASNRLKSLENDLADFNRSITSGSATPEARARLDELANAREEALADLYARNAVVTDYFAKVSPDSTFGQKLANWNRVSMLSSVTGRLFDVASTTATTALDTVNRGISSLIARGLNGRVGEGGAKTALPRVLPSAGDLRKAAGRTIDSARGKNQVRDVMAEISGMGTGRSELQNQSRGRFRNLVKAGTEAPTELTRYIEDNEIRRSGYQKAVDELGLKGDDADLYADSYSSVATTAEKYSAQQEHLKANMLHNNVVSSKVDAVANTLLQSSSTTGKTSGAILKSIVAPFTRFIGGMTHRTFTDMNVVHNVWEMRKAIKNGDTQMLSNALAKATTNLGVGFATATVLAETGVLVDHDANGDSYAGLYFHVGDRYIPVGFAGLASVPMIVGYGINQATKAENPAEAFTAATTDTLSRVLASTGTAGFFGAENPLQTAVSGASSAISPSDSNSDERNWADVVGSMARQSIPAFTNDVNAVMNQIPAFNETGEAAETKVLTEDGKQNPIGTQIAKTQNAIPGLSQLLPRREGTPARDLIDRATKGNREGGEMKSKRETKESLSDWKKRLEDEGAPVTAEKISDLAKTGDYDKALAGAEYRLAELEADEKATENSKTTARRDIEDYKFGQQYDYLPTSNEAVETRAEKGEYEAAIAGWQLRMKRDEEEGNTPESKLNSQRTKIKRYEVFRDMDVPTGVVTAYEKSESSLGGVGVTAWRDMMDSGDPKLVAYAEQLYNLDKALVDKGAVKEPKYYWGKGGRGGRGGRGSGVKFSTNIGTLDGGEYSFAPMKAQAATFGPSKSAIPKLQKTPDYARKPKKIAVRKGTK